MKIISGGQTGVDQTGLFVARQLGYETGGTAPHDWKTDDGPAPWLADFGLVQSPFYGYRVRTIENVRTADLTVWFGDSTSPGGRVTIMAAARLLKPVYINPTGAGLRAILTESAITVLNVAGNRLRTNPGASEQARVALLEALAR